MFGEDEEFVGVDGGEGGGLGEVAEVFDGVGGGVGSIVPAKEGEHEDGVAEAVGGFGVAEGVHPASIAPPHPHLRPPPSFLRRQEPTRTSSARTLRDAVTEEARSHPAATRTQPRACP